MGAPDLSEFDAIAPPKCRCWFLRLSAEQKAKVIAAHEGGYSQRTIGKVVNGWGVVVSRSAVGNHFAQGHNCG